MKVLDCTLRDGGYYTDWQFNRSLVERYLKVMQLLSVDYVELGLRQFPSSKFLGPYAYSPDIFLKDLNLPKGPKYGVMLDAGTILNHDGSEKDLINKLFKPSEKSPISLVRVAAHPHETDKSEILIKILTDLGYETGLNIMQVSTIDQNYLTEIITNISNWEYQPDVLYFADSLGCMSPKEADNIFQSFKSNWNGEIGFHAHNNQGLALENATVCIKGGLNWVDSTVTGMGRGAGNLSTEDVYLNLLNSSSSSLNDLYTLASVDFETLKQKYKYGPNLLYRIAAKNNIHPTYVQTLLADQGVEISTHLSVIENIKHLEKPNKFSNENYQNCLSVSNDLSDEHGLTSHAEEFGNISGMYEGKDFLIIGGGKSITEHQFALKDFEVLGGLVSLSSNIRSEINFNSQLLCATSNNALISEINAYNAFKGQIIVPKHIDDQHHDLFEDKAKILNFGHYYSEQNLLTENFFATKYLLSGGYAIAAAIAMGANNIYIAGFDGYKTSDHRFHQMCDLLQFFLDAHGRDKIVSLTKTSYPLEEISIYALLGNS